MAARGRQFGVTGKLEEGLRAKVAAVDASSVRRRVGGGDELRVGERVRAWVRLVVA